MKWFTSIAVASLAAVLGFTSVAFADASFYGRVTAGAEHVDDDKEDDDGTWDFGSRNFATRIGFKGDQDLGNGMSAGFKIEQGFAAEGGPDSKRHRFVYLSGGWGKLTLGNQDNPYMTARNWDQTFLYGGGFGLGSSYRHEGIGYSMSNGPFSLNVLAMAKNGDEDDPAKAISADAAEVTNAGGDVTRGTITAGVADESGNDGLDGWIIHAGYDFGIAAVNVAHQASNADYDVITPVTGESGDGDGHAASRTHATNLTLGAADENGSRDNTAIGFNGSVGAMDWHLAYQTSELNASGTGVEDNDITSVGGQLTFDMSEKDRVYAYYVAHSGDRSIYDEDGAETHGEDFTETIVGYTRDMGPGLRFIAEYAARDFDLEADNAGSDWNRLGLVVRYVF